MSLRDEEDIKKCIARAEFVKKGAASNIQRLASVLTWLALQKLKLCKKIHSISRIAADHPALSDTT